MEHLKSVRHTRSKPADKVMTPPAIAREIVARYPIAGRVLDPCRGAGAFYDALPLGAEWAEIDDGRDFFKEQRKFDWIVSNPPYSILNRWLEHSFALADNVVYLLPIAKVFGSRERLRAINRYGGIVEVYAPWTGRQVGFRFGWALGAVYFQRGYRGSMQLTVEHE